MGWEPPSRIKERTTTAIVNHLGGNSALVRSAGICITVEGQAVKSIDLLGFAKPELNEDEIALIGELDRLAGRAKTGAGGYSVHYDASEAAALLDNIPMSRVRGS